MPDMDLVEEEILENAQFEEPLAHAVRKLDAVAPVSEVAEDNTKKQSESDYVQWAIAGNGKFSPVGGTVTKLSPGIYMPFSVPGMWGLEKLTVDSDEIYELPDMATNMVIKEADTFWNNEARYKQHNLLYKRGILLHGPPGSGKTVTVKLLMNQLVKRDGIVILVFNVSLAIMALKAIRRVEPNRNLITILEDIDEIMAANGESALLSLLDGENNINKVLNIATTNYPDRLGARIINRPSRFDRRVYVGMPGAEARSAYLVKATNGALTGEMLNKWVQDTDEMSVAHLRELVAAVYCLDQSYDDVITRLKEMASAVKSDAEFKGRSMGFNTPSTRRNNQASGF
jgi:hypothetical protein